MKLKFKVQPYQTQAVESVVDCFAGQVNTSALAYRMDPGRVAMPLETTGFKNADLQLPDARLLKNIHTVQRLQNLPLSEKLVASAGCKVNLDIEMETGTGKTYCYIKTMFEMNQRYGWNKFIVVVPSIAIREGVHKSLEITAEHFAESYGKKARFFIYNSKQLHQLESFSSDAGINVMIINIQAFNAAGKDNRRIYEELDDFQSRRPIDVISSNHPIVILDEPQKMEGAKTLDALSKFKPLMILRYSATHKTTHNKIHRLDALDAYNQKLVKKIAVRGIAVRGPAGTSAYLYLESIRVSKQAPEARMEIEVQLKGGTIQRKVLYLKKGDKLFEASGHLAQYKGYDISQIDANRDVVEFLNGQALAAGDAVGDATEATFRRLQIREAIKAHLEKERQLFPQGIKVLSLFFIDEVAKYRDYNQADEKGAYAHAFEQEYEALKAEYLDGLPLGDKEYRAHLSGIPTAKTHNGYFSIDRKTKHLIDPEFRTRGEDAGLSDDVDAYDLILKDKERLLSFEEPVRFIFSHSALREGWDNPNVFVMGMLKHSDNNISRRQEVGRGLRLAVNQQGDRMDHPATVHSINVLTVVAGESYKDFVSNLQDEMSNALSERPRLADEAYFLGKTLQTEAGPRPVTVAMAKQISKYLTKNGYTDDADHVTEAYHSAKAAGTLASLPPDLAPLAEPIFALVDNVFSNAQLPELGNDRNPKTNPLNDNFEKKEFKELWSRINHKAVYRVEFDSAELIKNAVAALDAGLRVTPLQYTVQGGEQLAQTTFDQMKAGDGFMVMESATTEYKNSIRSMVSYDLLGKLAEGTQLTRKTVAAILGGTKPFVFDQFKQNPEHFISETRRLINEQKAAVIIERLSYDQLAERHDVDIFTTGQTRQDFSKASSKLNHHIYDYVVADSKVEREFAQDLDTSSEVVVYAKLPRGFLIPTPVGDYNPDWAISFKEGMVKYVYFVAETKGSMSSLQLRGIEETKIECARKFFDDINRRINPENVKYEVVTSYEKLMEIVGRS
jgi:type III restriction enzyme